MEAANELSLQIVPGITRFGGRVRSKGNSVGSEGFENKLRAKRKACCPFSRAAFRCRVRRKLRLGSRHRELRLI